MTRQRDRAGAPGTPIPAIEPRWRTLLQACSDVITLLDAEGRVLQSIGPGTGARGSSAWTAADWGQLHPDEEARARRAFRFVLGHPGQPHRGTYRLRQPDGQWEVVEYTAVNHLDDPLIGAVVVTTRNVTEVKLAEALLAAEAHTLELIARGAPRRQALTSITTLVDAHTGAATGIFLAADGAGPTLAAVGSLPSPLVAPTATHLGTHPQRLILGDGPWVVADLATHPQLAPVAGPFLDAGYSAAWAMPIADPAGAEVLGVIVGLLSTPRGPTEREREVLQVAADLAGIAIERDQAQRDLEHRARHDQLTGLPNRWAILEHLDAALARRAAGRADGGDPAATVAVLLVDIDRFRVVNDSLGHSAGDRLLVQFAQRLAALDLAGGFVGHFGGDELAVVVEGATGLDDVVSTASQVELALGLPFTVDDDLGHHEIYLSASVGAALAGSGATGHGLLRQADAAMYRAKDRGRDRLEVYDQDLQDRATEQLRLDRELRLAVEGAQLQLHYQPEVDLASGTIIGVEALLRWDHPDRGVVGPGEFIDAAEQTGLIVRIGRWVIEEAVRQARAWVDALPEVERLTVAVNLSARQLTSPGLVPTVARVIDRHGWDPADLTLELTESILIDDADATLAVLRQLKALGVRLAIDDFGTGYSSLSYLHRFPVDIVKVDRAFVGPLGADGEGSAVATAVLHMARALGLVAVAEGVERQDQLAGLRALGCDWAQGFLFAEPRPADEVADLLTQAPRW